jgi:hypothetical protein
MDEDFSQEFNLPKDFNIEEIEVPEEEKSHDIVFAGTVELWKQLELSEKAKVRPYIASIVISLWAIGTSLCLIRFLMTGDFIFISPSTLLTVPIATILKFYFRSD